MEHGIAVLTCHLKRLNHQVLNAGLQYTTNEVFPGLTLSQLSLGSRDQELPRESHIGPADPLQVL